MNVTWRRPVTRVRLQRADAKQLHSRQVPINLVPIHARADDYETSERLRVLSRYTEPCDIKSFTIFTCSVKGHAVAQLVEALRYKLEGRGFDSRWFHWNFSLT